MTGSIFTFTHPLKEEQNAERLAVPTEPTSARLRPRKAAKRMKRSYRPTPFRKETQDQTPPPLNKTPRVYIKRVESLEGRVTIIDGKKEEEEETIELFPSTSGTGPLTAPTGGETESEVRDNNLPTAPELSLPSPLTRWEDDTTSRALQEENDRTVRMSSDSEGEEARPPPIKRKRDRPVITGEGVGILERGEREERA